MIRRLFERLRAVLTQERLLRISAVLTLLALGLMVWSVLVPTPLPVMLAMTVGQAIGTVAFAIYIGVVVRTIRAGRGR